ncbi:hypothetical protein GOP47_0005991 [Adiantum capillus-veneris]|uniref:phosphoribosylanthranilate isomerase n=1 Tax=Adiantum capillus-veneris TaxID=13818 RepID=A0A9D4V2L8_ADICA|nr:hypothetical protein GOP47_0005991 [Adiantum capillus-veneris]
MHPQPVQCAHLGEAMGILTVPTSIDLIEIGAIGLHQSNISVTIRQANSLAMQGRRLESTAVLKVETVNVDSHSTIKAPLVKICGVTNVNDATLAAQAGASFVGMILWPKSKRSICVGTAKEIAHAVRFHNAEPVGVFVDEDAETIESFCMSAGIGIAQLHGEGARASLTNLPSHLETIYVVHVDKSGILQTPLPGSNSVDWILLDSLQGGSGHSFDWEKLKSLLIKSKKDGLLKDPARVLSFIDAVKGCTNPI